MYSIPRPVGYVVQVFTTPSSYPMIALDDVDVEFRYVLQTAEASGATFITSDVFDLNSSERFARVQVEVYPSSPGCSIVLRFMSYHAEQETGTEHTLTRRAFEKLLINHFGMAATDVDEQPQPKATRAKLHQRPSWTDKLETLKQYEADIKHMSREAALQAAGVSFKTIGRWRKRRSEMGTKNKRRTK